MDQLTKRLLGLMALGCYIHQADGHIWLYCTDNNGDYESFQEILDRHNIGLNTKFYGGILECLDTVDHILKACNRVSLEDRYDPNWHFLGNGGVALDRISPNAEGLGGLQ
jgi:hypothetical protein